MQEARENPFYRMASHEGLKKDIFRRVENISTTVRSGDRIITVFLAHGRNDTSGLQLRTGRLSEWRHSSSLLGPNSVQEAAGPYHQRYRRWVHLHHPNPHLMPKEQLVSRAPKNSRRSSPFRPPANHHISKLS